MSDGTLEGTFPVCPDPDLCAGLDDLVEVNGRLWLRPTSAFGAEPFAFS